MDMRVDESRQHDEITNVEASCRPPGVGPDRRDPAFVDVDGGSAYAVREYDASAPDAGDVHGRTGFSSEATA
jgi:hypothetical protein